MKSDEMKVIGLQKREKDGKVSYTIHAEMLFDEWENGQGFKAVTEWTRIDCSSLKSGMIIKPFYSKGFKGAAVLSGFDIVS